MKGISYRGNTICFGKYALQALEPAWITSRQIEAGRRAMTTKCTSRWKNMGPYISR
ncbi:putative ribosomal protein L16 [Helianthus debilis subsp. tardiflorus]